MFWRNVGLIGLLCGGGCEDALPDSVPIFVRNDDPAHTWDPQRRLDFDLARLSSPGRATPPATYPAILALACSSASGFDVVDVDTDGRPDIVCTSDGGLTAWFQDGVERFISGAVLPGTGGVLSIADLDADGLPDVARLDPMTSELFVHFGRPGRAFAPVDRRYPAPPSGDDLLWSLGTHGAAVDLDDDGHRDLIAIRSDLHGGCNPGIIRVTAYVYLSDGAGGFIARPPQLLTQYEHSSGHCSLQRGPGVLILDLDGDGRVDVGLTGRAPMRWSVQPDGDFAAPVPVADFPLLVGFLNGDSVMDRVIRRDVALQLQLSRGKRFVDLTVELPLDSYVYRLLAEDFGDGRSTTLYMTHPTPDTFAITAARSTSTQLRTAPSWQLPGPGWPPPAIAIADMDADGVKDIVLWIDGKLAIAHGHFRAGVPPLP